MNNMKKKLVLFASVTIALASCQTTPKEDYSWIKKGLDVASAQLQLSAEEVSGTGMLPRSIRTGYDMDFLCRQLERDSLTFKDSLRAQPTPEQLGKRRLCGVYDWTSGFFPGSLWYAYELTGNDTLKAEAIQYTNLLNPVRYYKGTHDLGFMVNCSYGNAERLAPNDTIAAVMRETADNLCGRFNDSIGAIRSWDFGTWNFPVIIDNMMNLDLLFNVAKATGDHKYKDIAIKHAMTTMNNHFRPDYTCWHVVSYNNDGTVERKQTHQGKNDDSSWARGQAWAVYGYTACYRETNDSTFLNFAIKVADMIMDRVKTDDTIPYWDYDAPVTEETPRDASAASVTASAMIELSTMVPDGQKYLDYAEKILKSLSSDAYLAKVGDNQGYILMHSVGSLPNGSEIDTPLNYADYYYLEALKRFMDLKKLRVENGELRVTMQPDNAAHSPLSTLNSQLIKWYDHEAHKNFDVCADDHCQRYQGITRASTPQAVEAVSATRGEVLMYEGKICDARFSKCCGGAFEEFQNCWENVRHPYLIGQRDSQTENKLPDLTVEAEADKWIRTSPVAFCNTQDKKILSQVLNNYDQETADFYRWKVSYSQEELSELIHKRSDIDFGKIIDLIPIERGTSGRLVRLKIVGTLRTLTIGKELEIRRTLSTSHLYSSAFVVDKEYKEEEQEIPSRFILTGAGWGHGVGLCQIGAAVMGEQGYKYEEILSHYYPGSTIERQYK